MLQRMDAPHHSNTNPSVPLANQKQMNRHHPYDPRTWKQTKGATFQEGTYKVLPDNGMRFDRTQMRMSGYTLYQDYEHGDGYKTRWWFKDVKTWEARTDRIEMMGYTAIDKLQIT